MSLAASTTLALELVREHGQCSRRWLQRALDVDEDLFGDICFELVEVRRVVAEEEGVLRWVGPLAAAAADRPTPMAERRHITVLYCDLSGSTSLSGEMDAEDLRDLIVEYLQSAGSVVENHGGTVARYLGDGLLAYFGWPSTHEDDAARAVSAGLQIVEQVAVQTTSARALAPQALSVRVGLHTGPAVIGDFGSGVSREALATGQTPNVGARIEAVAEPGTVCISDATERLVRGLFDVKDRGLFALKGVAQATRVYRILRERRRRSRFDAAATELVPLVGRADVTRRLEEALRRLRTHECVAIALCGEPGIGKSRLVHYFKGVLPGDVLLLEGECHRMAQNSPLQPVAQALQPGWIGKAAPLEAIERVVRACPQLNPEQTVPLLAAMLQIEIAPERRRPVEEWSPRLRRSATFEAMVAIVLEQAARRPVLFVLEDAHWADPSTLEWLALLHRRATGCAVMFLLTFRLEFSAPLHDFERIELHPLGDDEVRQLVASVAARDFLPPGFVERVLQRAGGNPLFVEQLTRDLLHDAGGHAHDAAGQTAKLTEAEIPTTLYGTLMSRLDRIGPARRLIQIASTIGQHFELPLLQAVAEIDDATLQDHLGALAEAQLLRRVDATTWVFRHALIQDAAAHTLLRKTLRNINARIARALVGQAADARIPPERIAHHYAEAGETFEAIDWWREAGTQALRRSANDEAEAHFRRALDLLSTLPSDSRSQPAELLLRTRYAVSLTLSRGWAADEVALQYRRAQELCKSVVDAPELLPTRIGLQTYLIVSGQPREAQQMAYETLALAQRSADPGSIVEAELDCGTTSFYLGEFERSLVHLRQVEALYLPERDHGHAYQYGKDPLAVAVVHRVMSQACCGQLDESIAHAHRNVRHVEAWPHPFSHLWALLGLASVLATREDYAQAGEVGARVVAAARELGYPNWEAQAMTFQGLGLAALGRHDEGIVLIETGLGQWRATGAQVGTSSMMAYLQRALLLAGRAERAREVAEESLAQIARTGEAWTHAHALRLHGEALLCCEGDAAAEPGLRRALERAVEMGTWTWALSTATLLAALLARRGAHDEARSLLARPMQACTGGHDTAPVIAARRVWAELNDR